MKRSVHIDYNQGVRIYHVKVADIAAGLCVDGGKVCDIGAGVGHTLKILHELRPDLNLTSVDLDATCLERLKENVPTADAKLVQSEGEIEQLSGDYDLIIMSHSLEHMLRPYDTLKTVASKVKAGGYLVLAVPNAHNPKFVFNSLMKRRYANKGHLCIWDRAHWCNFIENIMGFENVEYEGDFVMLPFLHQSRIFWPFEKMLVRLFPWFSTSNIAVVRV
jgi:2-polyprenyl-3-methyl-5-hydroxy-6-metoxy-1,4-benzoquinol methylase